MKPRQRNTPSLAGALVLAAVLNPCAWAGPAPASRIAAPVAKAPPAAPGTQLLAPLLESGRLAPGETPSILGGTPGRFLDRLYGPESPTIDYTCIELTDVDHPAAPETLDVQHYDIAVDRIDRVSAYFHAVTTITFRALKPLQAVDFDLGTVQILDVLAGPPGASVPVAYAHEDSVLHVLLPQSVAADSTAAVTVDYEAPTNDGSCLNTRGMFSGFVFSQSGIHTFGEPTFARHWYPCHDVPWDKATATLTLTVPSGLVGSGTGVLTEVGQDNGLDRLTWSVPVPVSNYLLALYVSEYLAIQETSPGGIPLQYYVYPELETAARIDFQHLPDMIDFFSTIYPYPYPRYAQSLGFFGGGMEHVMNSLIGQFFIHGNLTYETLFSHELAHQWWGDLVTTDSWRDIWLNEGFATYAEQLYTEHAYGWAPMRAVTAFFDSIYVARRDELDHPILDPPVANVFTFVVYEKGGRVLDMLRGVSRLRLMQGSPRPPSAWADAQLAGDDRFLAIFSKYAEDYAFKNATALDFQHEAEAQLGEDLTWFFDPWLRGLGYPQLAYDFVTTPTPTGVNLDVQVIQVQPWETRFPMPLQVRYRSGNQILDDVHVLNEDTTEWVVSLPPGDWDVELDPDDWLLEEHQRLSITPPSRPPAVFPNPSDNEFAIVGSLAGSAPARVALTVLDVQGRRVWEEDLGRIAPGLFSFRWNGQDLSGRRVRAGSYFARLAVGSRIESLRLVVLPGRR